MAKKKKTPAVPAVSLAQIVEATQAGTILYTSAADHAPLIALGHVEVNPGMANEAGHLATRATPAGIEAVRAALAQPAASASPKVSFDIAPAVPLPSPSGRGRVAGVSVYPFDKLEIGQSFFVPNTAERPDAAKSMASTVSSANARYAEEIPGQTKTNRKGETVPATKQNRQFVLRARTADEERKAGFDHGKDGVRIWRVEVKS